MRNRIHITSDGVNAHATLEVRASKIGIRILQLLLVAEIALFGWVGITLDAKELSGFAIPGLIIVIFFIGLPLKYLLWNLYGKEEMIVTAKSLSWRYDYRFFRTNWKTKKYDRLGTGFQKVRTENGLELGRLVFFNYSEDTGLPEVLHETTVLLSKPQIQNFDSEIAQIFRNDFLVVHGFIPFSEN